MKRHIIGLVVILIFFTGCQKSEETTWIRINQLGYLPQSVKTAVLVSKQIIEITHFSVFDANSGEKIFSSNELIVSGPYGPFQSTFRLEFTSIQQTGKYYIKAGGARSPVFSINFDVYDGTADFLLKYMRQQRCGFNPFLVDSCHTEDGYTMYGPMADSSHINVTGGWHDASDYLQYVTTSANATFNLLFAYRENPEVFTDLHLANGLEGKNGLPDILDEARWGLEWLTKMHPRPNWMFNQIADDRDHLGFRLPTNDPVSYGKGKERPVYFCSGKPQGLGKYKNRSSGTASTAAKFASAFAMGAQIFETFDPGFSEQLKKKAYSAYTFAKKKPGVCQTAPCRAPYFYEEDNWVDDMELASAELYHLSSSNKYYEQAIRYSEEEPVTPWMGADTAKHYQWYPFMNLGHYELSLKAKKKIRSQLIGYYRSGIQRIVSRADNNAFLIGIPFIWCSNNFVTALATQIDLYQRLCGDNTFQRIKTAMGDWLFGCNPWGVSMIVGLPKDGITARDPHSAFTHVHGYPIDGGLLDGPVYGSIFKNLKYVRLENPDEYAAFQSPLVVYHDDVGDYATNEPTMDGTASLVYYLSAMEKEGMRQKQWFNKTKTYQWDQGAIIRGDTSKAFIALAFTGDEYADGAGIIRDMFKTKNIKASFFLTGNFYRNPLFNDHIKNLISDDHYLGAHSDRHLLYCDWQKRDSLLISKKEFMTDIEANYKEMEKFGIMDGRARFYLPPYEWYNKKISEWAVESGLVLVNYSPGTLSHADYTVPSMINQYVSSEKILQSIFSREKSDKSGLRGFILLMHIGSHPDRTDKFHRHLNSLIDQLLEKGYQFKRIDELLL